MMRKLKDLDGSLRGKKALVRVDFNVPIEKDDIAEQYRISVHKETIDYLVDRGAVLGLASHTSKVKSFSGLADHIGRVLGRKFVFLETCLENGKTLRAASPGTVFLCENVRYHEGEKKNDPVFAKRLADGYDLYINEAFSVSHREHASLVAITEFLPSYLGFNAEREIASLTAIKREPSQGKVLVLGGAKVETKVPLIKALASMHEWVLVGGVVANIFFQAKGFKTGASVMDHISLLKEVDVSDPRLVLPKDIIVSTTDGTAEAKILPAGDIDAGYSILDIGPETIKLFCDIVRSAKTVIWNGSLGLAEVERFSHGTRALLNAITRSPARSIIGGGDLVAILERAQLLKKVSYVSTGGGAMLVFLAGRELPGLKALGYYRK
jgi:phosphoglycerate kinase